MQQGSADRYFQEATTGNPNADKLVPEGIEGRVPYKGSLVSDRVPDGRRRARQHGLLRLRHHRGAARARPSSWRSPPPACAKVHVHDVQITKEAPNYRGLIEPQRAGRAAATSASTCTTDCIVQHDKILILDFGSQVTQLIARRVREAARVLRGPSLRRAATNGSASTPDGALKGVILSGSHASLWKTTRLRAPQAVFELGVPVLGICYGMQTMAQQLGGKVEGGHKREFGYAEVRARGHTALLDGIEDFTHRRRPRHAERLDEPRRQGDRDAARLQADGLHRELPDRRHGRRGRAASTRVQFHPEVTHTMQGKAILERFVLRHLRRQPDWVMRDHIAEAVRSDPQAGRRRGSDPRPVGRRRFVAWPRR